MAAWQFMQAMLCCPLVWPGKRLPEKLAAWQFAQNVPAGMPEEELVTLGDQLVLGPLRMNLEADPCGPFGSAVVSDSWQSVQVMRLVLVHGETTLPVLPTVAELVARTGWKETLAGLNSFAWSVSTKAGLEDGEVGSVP